MFYYKISVFKTIMEHYCTHHPSLLCGDHLWLIPSEGSVRALTLVVVFPHVSTSSSESPSTSKLPVSYEFDRTVLAWTNSPSKYVDWSLLSTCTANPTTFVLLLSLCNVCINQKKQALAKVQKCKNPRRGTECWMCKSQPTDDKPSLKGAWSSHVTH